MTYREWKAIVGNTWKRRQLQSNMKRVSHTFWALHNMVNCAVPEYKDMYLNMYLRR